jgi:hypothetical protein
MLKRMHVVMGKKICTPFLSTWMSPGSFPRYGIFGKRTEKIPRRMNTAPIMKKSLPSVGTSNLQQAGSHCICPIIT